MMPFALPSRLGTHVTSVAMVDELPTPIFMGDQYGIHYANRSAIALFGIDPWVTGVVSFAELHAQLRTRCPLTDESMALGDHPFTQALRGSAATRDLLMDLPGQTDGSALQCSGVPLWQDKQPVGAVVTYTDVSQLHRTSKILLRANQELEQFANIAAHDIREPLRAIHSFLDLALRQPAVAADPKGARYVGLARDGAGRLQNLIDGLMKLTRISRSDMRREFFSCHGVVRDVLGNLAALIDDCHAQVTVGQLPELYADRTHFLILFQNLLENALKYRRPDTVPELRIAAQDGALEMVFSVADNGIGIPIEYQKSIFAPFRRVHAASTAAGNGLGLDICQKIVERHHGRIWVESIPGIGSTFFFAIPRHPETSALDEDGSRRMQKISS